MKSGFALSILGHSLVLFFLVGAELFRSPRFINPTEDIISIELISEVELNRDNILSESNVVPSDLDQILETEDNLQDIPEFVQPIIPDLNVQTEVPEIPTNSQILLPDIPQPIEPPGIKIGVPEGVAESIVLKDTIPLPKAADFKLPEIPKVTSEYNPIERPELKVADITQEATVPSEDAKVDENPEPIEESSAKEASTPVVVTEANKAEEPTVPLTGQETSRDLLALGSPTSRPQEFTTPDDIDISELISKIVEDGNPNEIIQDTPKPEPVKRQTLTRGEIERLTFLIEQNWNVGALSSEAKRITLTVRIFMDTKGKPINIELQGQTGGTTNGTAVETAFDVARRAITKGLENGHDLPIEKYDLWKEVIYTFNPENIRNR